MAWKSTQALRHLCEKCGVTQDSLSPSESLLKCDECKYSHYCSKECQKSHWNLHELVCSAMRHGLHLNEDGADKQFVSDVHDWRKGSAMLFGAMAKVAIPLAQRDTHCLVLYSQYDGSRQEVTVEDGEEFPKPNIQIKTHEVLSISSLPEMGLQHVYDALCASVKPRLDMYALCHIIDDIAGGEPLVHVSSVGHEPELSYPIEEYVWQANQGIIKMGTL
mmetsp:Transcript_36684/g.68253  ORF Transcript_36684/g.68253 Transcript_36684/m.68253 type:complete len:219 (+) Transcript_36684:135-791(+)